MFAQYRGLSRSVYVIVLANVFNALGTFVRPLMALLLTDKLNYSKDYAGFIIMLAGILVTPAALIGGKLVDVLGRKKIILICNLLSAISLLMVVGFFDPVSFIVLALSASFWQAMAYPAISAVMADITTTDNRKAAFSLSYLGKNIGFAIGPLIAGFLYKEHLTLLFMGDALTTLVFIMLIALWVPETRPSKEQTEGLSNQEQPVEGSAWTVLVQRPILLAFALIQMLLTFVYAQHVFSLPLQMVELYHENGATVFGTLASVNGLVVIIFTTLITELTAKFKSTYNMTLVGVLYGIGFGMLYFVHSLPLLIMSTAIWTLGEILSVVNSNVFIADNTPASHRGRLNAIIQTISGTGFTLAPWLAGLCLKVVALRSIWVISLVISALAACFMYLLHFFENRQGSRANTTRLGA
jgi:MFS family permease